MDDLIELISVTFETDEIGQRRATETTRSVWAQISSISRAEWFQGGQMGIRPSFVMKTPVANYNGEKSLIYNGQRYTVYRTYNDYTRDVVELYVEERTADIGEHQG